HLRRAPLARPEKTLFPAVCAATPATPASWDRSCPPARTRTTQSAPSVWGRSCTRRLARMCSRSLHALRLFLLLPLEAVVVAGLTTCVEATVEHLISRRRR